GKLLGTHTFSGEAPGWIVFREGDSSEPVYGELDKPLVQWITGLPREDSPEHREATALNRIVKEVRPVLTGDPPAVVGRLARCGKVLMWDLASNRPSPVQQHLPPGLGGHSSDSPLTIVGVVRIEKEQAQVYNDGTPGYRAVVTLSLATWPDKVSLGRYKVVG